ncbi:MAG: histidinol dehydrogenase [Phycisphaerales bacterium]|jgi:histidinol dehydrogenase|nr:histidinol dehydrogenase [Phycisphaerales bacterium]MBT7170252.1 histidinol dehydrogenase [Phycisphaerales bacterium]
MKRITYTQSDYRQQTDALRDLLRAGGLVADGETTIDVPVAVKTIIDDVATRGDQAVIELEAKFDQATLSPESIRVSAEEIATAHSGADEKFLAVIRQAVENIREYQKHIKHTAPADLVRAGRRLGVRYTPIDRVAVYVPGGRAIYPSTVLMTVVPALVAGVSEVVMVSPPSCDGDIHPMVLALAGELGVSEVYRVGGAVAVAACAVGTESIPAVQKIVGPGNAFVAEAKRQLFGRVGIDSIAGPSEVLILADDSANPDYVAGDLFAQAEHDPGSAILVTPSAALADAVDASIAKLLPTLERAEAIESALNRYSATIVTETLDDACEVANDFATEHLQVTTADLDDTLSKIRHAGAIFLGACTPVPLGDYFAGPSHVLPTGGGAKMFSPLSVNDFLKSSSTIAYDQAAINEDGPAVVDFATREGLTAHAKAVELRIQ